MYHRLLCIFIVCLFAVFPLFVQAQEEGAALCPGKDLREDLDQATLADIQAKSDRIPNGKGRFWRIEKEGIAPSWLLGTKHSLDPRATLLSSAQQTAFDKASHLAVEIIERSTFSPQMWAQFMKKEGLRYNYESSEDLKSAMTDEQFQELERALARHHSSYTDWGLVKPWMIWAMMARSPCQRAHMSDKNNPSLDVKLGLQAWRWR